MAKNEELSVVDAPKTEKIEKKRKAEITVKANKKGRHIMKLMNVLRVIVIPVYWLLKPFRFYGPRKVADGACVYVGNHYTLLDPVYPACTTWEGIHYVAKKETFQVPVLSWLLRRCKAISANRDGNDVRAILDCFKCLKNGEKIAIYPEGTRNRTKEVMLPFHHGAAMMAIKAKVPIVPIVMYGKPKFFKVTHILIGAPIEMSEYYGRKLSEEEMGQADEKIRQYMLEMRAKHAEFLANKKKKGKKS